MTTPLLQELLHQVLPEGRGMGSNARQSVGGIVVRLVRCYCVFYFYEYTETLQLQYLKKGIDKLVMLKERIENLEYLKKLAEKTYDT